MTEKEIKKLLKPIANNPKALREILDELEEEFCRRGGGCKSNGTEK